METTALRIAFIGKNSDSRRTCARYLERHHKFKQIALEDPIEDFVRRLLFLAPKRRVRWEKKMRFYDAIYSVDPDILVNYIADRVRKSSMRLVIRDVRYLNEVKVLEKLGFVFIRVTTDQKPLKYIKRLSMNTQSDATLYYEWFAQEADVYVKPKYSLHHENRISTGNKLDRIIENLTQE